MNKQRYRIVFNRARGLLMAVQETARAGGKSASGEGTSSPGGLSQPPSVARSPSAMSLVAWAALWSASALAMVSAPAWAQNKVKVGSGAGAGTTMRALAGSAAVNAGGGVVANPKAAADRKPIVDAAGNGVPLVHIAPPSKGGVSRNEFTEFNVDERGLILNNSTTSVQTQLGGWIGGNPQLGYVPARLILNEVTGTGQSVLKGVMEVAGRKADVVIANPNGLLCDGCGFINTSRATLSTGTPVFNSAGSLSGFDVRQGQINVGPGGLDASTLQQLDLIARGIVIEGQVWAQNLNLVAGANQVVYGSLGDIPQLEAQTSAAAGASPSFAVDLRELGALYAQNIYLIATEKGVGVNSTGRMAAIEGSLQLTAGGDLSVKDVYARDAVLLASAGNMRLNGQIQTPTTTDGGHVADIRLNAAGALDNSGTVDAAGVLAVQAGSVNNQGNLIQRDSGRTANVRSEGAFNNSGVIYSAGDLAVSGQTVSDDQGTFLAEGRLNVSGPQVFLHGTQMAAGNDLAVAATSGELNATATQITAGGQVRLEAATQLSQVEGVLQAQLGVALRGANISNRDSTVLAGQSLTVQAAEALDNTGGELMGGGDVSLSADHIVNDASATRAAWIVSEGAVNLAAAHGVSNQAGVISGKTALNLEVGQGVLNNLQGTIVSDGRLDIRAAAVVNVAGQMVAGSVSGGTLNLAANELDNRQGNVSAGAAAVLNVRDGLNNQSGVILSGTAEGAAEAALSIHAGSLQNTGGQVVGRDSLRLDTGALTNDLGVLASSLGEFNLNAAEVGNAGGLISAATNATLTTRALDNTGGVISAAADLHSTSSASVDNHGGIMVAQGVVDVTAGAALRNDAGQIVSNGGSVRLAAAQLSNDAGLVGAALDVALISDAGLSNAGGQILAGNAVSVWATGLGNQGGAVKAGGALSVIAADVNNTQGTLFSQQVTRVSAAGDVNNAGGEISAARSSSLAGVGDVVVQAGGQFSNRSGLLVAEGALVLTAAQVNNTDGSTVGSDGVSVSSRGLINDRGSVASGADLSIRADALTNLDGAQVLAGGALSIQGVQGGGTAIENHAATLSGRESVSVVAQSLNNDGGRLDSAGTVDVAVLQGGVLSNRLGVLTSTGGTHIQAQALDNAGGELSSAATVEVDTAGQTLANHGGRILAGSDLTVRAGALENLAGGLVVSQTGSVSVHAQQIDNGASTLSAGTDVSILGAQKVSNQGGSMVAGHSVQVSASVVDNTAGAMVGNTGQVSLQADVVTNALGLISGARRVDVASATERLVNDGGQILSDTAVSLSGHGISNVAGKLAADTVHVDAGAGVLDNTQGQLVGGTSLVLDQRGLINSQGLVATGGDLGIDTHGSALDNKGGQVAAQGALNLQTGALDNEGGTLSSGQTVQIHSTQLNNDAGRVMAVGDVSLQTGVVTNRAGLLASTGAASQLTASVASLDNQDGQVSGADVRLASAGNVLNNGGSIAASRDLVLTAELLTNGASALASGQVLAARDALLTVSTTVTNHASLIQGGRDTVVQAAALDNDGGLLESHGSLTTTVSGAASNVGGIIRTANEAGSASNAGDLKFVAAQLDNTGGTLSSAANLTLDVQAGDLRNVASDLADARIVAGAQATIAAGALINQSSTHAGGPQAVIAGQSLDVVVDSLRNTGAVVATGSAGADGHLNLQVSDVVENDGGTLHAVGDLTVQARSLSNQAGQILSSSASGGSTPTLSILTPGGTLDNSHAGQIAAYAGDLTINTQGGAVDNSQAGVVFAQGALSLTTGALNNAEGGSLLATRALSATTLAFNNDAGLVQGGSVSVDTQGQALINTHADAHAAAAGQAVPGGIVSDGGIVLRTGALNNQSVSVVAAGGLQMQASGEVNNTSGVLAGAQGVTLDAASQQFNNTAGTLLSTAGDASVRAASVENTGGTLAAAGMMSVAATSGLHNGAGPTGASVGGAAAPHGNIVGYDVRVTADQIDNQGGRIAADHDATLNAALLNNESGEVSALHDVAVVATTLQNQNGKILANNRIDLSTASGSFAGTVYGNDVALTVSGDYTNTSTLVANRDLTIQADRIDNQGVLSSGQTLTGKATGDINNAIGGEMSGANVHLQAGGTVSNEGLINSTADGGLALIEAANLKNLGRIYGDEVDVQASDIRNEGTGTIAARSILNLAGQNISNTGPDALLLSLGDMNIGGTLNGAGSVQGSAQRFENTAARVEADADLSIAADTILNANAGVTTAMTGLDFLPPQFTSQSGRYVIPKGSTTRYPEEQCQGIGGSGDKNYCIVHPDVYGQRTTLTAVYSQQEVCEGSDSPVCHTVTQANYAWDSPVFAEMGVSSMSSPRPAEPGGSGGCSRTFDTEAGAVTEAVNSPACNSWRSAAASWDSSFSVALNNLDTAVNAYNASVNEDNRRIRFEDYTLLDLTGAVEETYVVSSAPAQILSGGNMSLTGLNIRNVDSHIVAGGLLAVNGLAEASGEEPVTAGIENITTQGRHIETIYGTSRFTHVDSCGSFGSDHCRRWDEPQPYEEAPVETSIALNTTVYVQNVSETSGGTAEAAAAGTAGPSANGAGRLTGITMVRATQPKGH